MKSDQSLLLAIAGTIAVHIAVITVSDILVVTHPFIPEPPAPHVELVDLAMPEPPPPPPPEPPKLDEPPPPPEPETKVPEVPRERPQARMRAPDPTPPPPTDEPPPPVPTNDQAGGDEVVKMEDIPTGAVGNVPVEQGKQTSKHQGRGGTGGGTGAGIGSGSAGGAEPPPPITAATIKTAAKPMGDFGYVDAGREYPAEARQLGIEGQIKVKLIVDDKGVVRKTTLLTKLGHGLDEWALARAPKLRFTPAIDTDDHPVASIVIWTFTMTLPK